MILKKLLESIPTRLVEGDLEREVTGIVLDSRRVSPGKVFVACPGHNADGHDYISEAIDRGAVAIICERNGFASHRAAKIVVQDTRAIMPALACEFYGHPSRKLGVIGITGTNGKTTTSFLLKNVLEAQGIKTGLITTVHYDVAGRILPAHRTTPEALDLQQLFAQMVREGCEACVMEVSSHALEQARVNGTHFDVGVFTNLTQDHLDYHGTMENYFNAKARFFTLLENSAKRARAVINGDDEYGRRLMSESKTADTVSFGLLGDTTLQATEIELDPSGMHFNVNDEGTGHSVGSQLIGRHNVYNSLAAIGVTKAMGLDVGKSVEAMAKTPPVPGRLERLNMGQPFNVIVDYAHTADALENVLTTLREVTPNRILLTFGCGGNRDAGKRPKMGEIAARLAHYTVVTSDNPRKEPPAAIAAQIEAGYRSVRTDGSRTILDRHAAIRDVIHHAQAGDTVVIAGKGHETFQELKDSVVPFDDRRHAAEVIAAELCGKKILRAA